MDGSSAPDPTADPVPPTQLSARDLAILAFEGRWWTQAGAKEQAIRAEFDYSAARYYQVLGVLIDSPTALAHDPMLVKRLQRMRDAREQARARRTLRPTDVPQYP
ncbi:MAG: DUF3263 domain-containing protein [Ramlibacter sp.]|nr:DUF3263 domain-containing protein [Cryobacterium sp.]